MRQKPKVIDGAEPAEGLSNHSWPAEGEHLWGKWSLNTVNPGKKATKYRVCVHPECNAVEVKDAG